MSGNDLADRIDISRHDVGQLDVAIVVPCCNEEHAIAKVVADFHVQQGVVPRWPTAVLSAGSMLLAFLSFACGLILDTVTRGRREAKPMAYLG